jgi:glycerol-3-phosphate dehydrogenase (NAD(P)+)
VLSGPSFAREVAMKLPTAVTVAGCGSGSPARCRKAFSFERFRAYTSTDVVACSSAGRSKRGGHRPGCARRAGFGNNARARSYPRLAEITRAAVRRGATR